MVGLLINVDWFISMVIKKKGWWLNNTHTHTINWVNPLDKWKSICTNLIFYQLLSKRNKSKVRWRPLDIRKLKAKKWSCSRIQTLNRIKNFIEATNFMVQIVQLCEIEIFHFINALLLLLFISLFSKNKYLKFKNIHSNWIDYLYIDRVSSY